MNDVTTFNFRSHNVRMVIRNGEPWFVAKDVCAVLELGNTTEALRPLDDDEKITLSNSEGNPRAGNPLTFNAINESGLYALVFKSRKPQAKEFRKWVFEEVLPRIKKTLINHGLTENSVMNTSLISATSHSNFGKTMSSREIAELTGKEHFHVMRDIKALIEQEAINQSSFGLVEYKDAKGEKRPMYLLDFDATMTLVTGYDAVLRAKVIKRWRELETGEAKPVVHRHNGLEPNRDAGILAYQFEGLCKLASFFGYEGNQALLCADKAVRKLHGISPMALLEIELKSPDNEALMIATEIGKRLDSAVSAKAVNLALAAMDFMERFEYRAGKFEWRLTEKGKEYGVYLDTGKVHSNGTPIQQIKWRESVIPLIQQYLRVQG